jgi:hypothetical protein
MMYLINLYTGFIKKSCICSSSVVPWLNLADLLEALSLHKNPY